MTQFEDICEAAERAIEARPEVRNALERAARLAVTVDTLRQCRDELDALRLWQAGAHLDAAIQALVDAS